MATACLLCGQYPIAADHAVHVPGHPDDLIEIPFCGDCHTLLQQGDWFGLLQHKLLVMKTQLPYSHATLRDREVADQYHLIADIRARYKGCVLIR